ncbi:Methyltransferase type 12 [Neofusicoccum parvum]|nr:Methyltransferase type 12 [Neofusicoccum parvum]
MTQPSLTTTFDTSLIDLSTLPEAQRQRHQQQQQQQQFPSGSFSSTDADTDNASDFAADAPSQATDAFIPSSAALARTPGPSSSDEDDESSSSDDDGKSTAAAPPKTAPPQPNQSRRRTNPPTHPSSSSSTAAATAPPPPTHPPRPTPPSTKHPHPSSPSPSPSASSPSPPTSPPPSKRRKMAPPQPANPPTPIRHLDTTAAYDAWAPVYDADGNALQAVDDVELEALLPAFLGRVAGEAGGAPVRLLDLGCGTGRNTGAVVGWAKGWAKGRVEVVGVDGSGGMVGRARGKLIPLVEDSESTSLTLLVHDPFAAGRSVPPPLRTPFHGVLSTLVLEHLPLETFFGTVEELLVPGGYALITNMHPEMGAKSQAGFVSTDEQGRAVKIRGKSWVHGVEETVEAARSCGLVVVDVLGGGGEGVDGVREREIDEALIKEGRVGERGWKWVGVKVWFGFVVRKNGGAAERKDEDERAIPWVQFSWFAGLH